MKVNSDATHILIETYHSLVRKYRKIEKDSTEKEIHDKRVILRKVFPILEAYKINPLKIRNSEKAFLLYGKLRDIQIQLMLLDGVKQNPEINDYYLSLKQKELKLKKEADKFVKKKKLIFPAIHPKSEIDSAQIISKTQKSFRKLSQKSATWDMKDGKAIHKIRIACKKFRYQVEILSYVAFVEEETLEKLKGYQDKLGEIQDYKVLIDGITKFFSNREQTINIQLFEEKHSLLINEFQQDIKDFLTVCSDVISLKKNEQKSACVKTSTIKKR